MQTRSNTPEDISIHSLHTEGDEKKLARERQQRISIHSLHTEGDDTEKTQAQINSISIHSLHTEGDNNRSFKNLIIINFNPLPPHGGRRRCIFCRHRRCYFNPLPPHGGRPRYSLVTGRYSSFQSTPSTRRETAQFRIIEGDHKISIHSLHTEGDVPEMMILSNSLTFQSTPSTRRETPSTLTYL